MKKHFLSIILITISFLLSIIMYSKLPSEVAIHWNIHGEADGFASKLVLILTFAFIFLLMLFLKIMLPKMEQLNENHTYFEKEYDRIMNSVFILLLFIQAGVYIFNLGYAVRVENIMFLGVGLLLMELGYYMPKFKQNSFVGIKTPWTLKSEEVWKKTHIISGKVYMVIGLLFMSLFFLPSIRMYIVFFCIVAMLISTIVVPYVLYKKLK